MARRFVTFATVIGLWLAPLTRVKGHGFLSEPLARNALWRSYSEAPKNYNDNAQFCGGFAVQVDNGGKCGVCGDPYNAKNQPHIYPGKYATGKIVRTYKQGQVIDIKVQITANHKGWFEIRVGDIGTPPITQAKLKYLLPVVGTRRATSRYALPSNQTRLIEYKVRLPSYLTCNHCVLQWWYKTGNSWGCLKDKSGHRVLCAMGLGDQETFVNCADIAITATGLSPPPSAPFTDSAHTTQKPTPTKTIQRQTCRAAGLWAGDPNIDVWCEVNCRLGNCPPSHCRCD